MPLTPESMVADWLDHPAGGPLLRGMLAEHDQDAAALNPVRRFPMTRLVELSDGRLSLAELERLAAEANAAGVEAPEPAPPLPEWQERITPGRFTGRTAVVTGAGSGIGRATASRVAREGGRVIAADVVEQRLDELVTALAGHEVVPVRADITSERDVAALVRAADGRVDALANVAGITDSAAPLHEVDDATWQRIFDVNVHGMFRLSRAVLPLMLDARRGSIVNVASEAALRGSTSGTAYTASKHAVVGITRSAAFMYATSGIRVNAVAPGGVATGIEGAMTSEFGRERIRPTLAALPEVAEPEHLAASISFLLSDDAVNINGVVLPSDGGWSVH
ncbi:SDR family NAD(P)-dependent oxidoreductase [Saccharopolyspora sp. MS10]|uniref:SDR family NAD(P)-dependent oxidoreductase n=1 Tax=Saccharopolyspora sp. MS10 TaxID=3385973 RepID=UPI0039A04A0F